VSGKLEVLVKTRNSERQTSKDSLMESKHVRGLREKKSYTG